MDDRIMKIRQMGFDKYMGLKTREEVDNIRKKINEAIILLKAFDQGFTTAKYSKWSK